MELYNLKPPKGSKKNRKRIGRGHGSYGKTAGRGHKGQKSRSGYKSRLGFEGGQMPLYRRVPKRGFTNVFASKPTEVNLAKLVNRKDVKEFNPEVMLEKKIVKNAPNGIKVIGNCKVDRAITVKVHKISKGAKEQIEKAGGKVEVIS